jgi:predicted amidohydrolase YtcJ
MAREEPISIQSYPTSDRRGKIMTPSCSVCLSLLKTRRVIAPLVGIAIIFFGLSSLAAGVERADVVYLNGNVYTMDEKNPRVSAMAIKNGRFRYVGSDKGARKYVGNKTSVVDLRSRTVLPGLIDSHLHFRAIGEFKTKLDVYWKPKQEILELVARAYQKARTGEWIEGFGWNQEVWASPVFPTKHDLDKIAPDLPVCLERTDGHAAWVNSKALEMASITKETLSPEGGEIIKDSTGDPTGMLTDTAANLVSKYIPPLDKQKMLKAFELAQEELLANGITSGQDAGCDLETMALLKNLYQSGKLHLRLYVRLWIPEGNSTPGGEVYAKGREIDLYQNRLTIRGIKLLVDGALGSRGAFMLNPYSDRAGYSGNQIVAEERLYALVKRAREAGFQVSVHAIGDAANHMALNVYERVLTENPDPHPRFRIEHAQVVTLEDIPRFARLGVIPSMQTVHATSDMKMAEKRIGPLRIRGAYAWRKFLNSGSIIANGTDAPVELINPFHGLYAAVTRKDRNGLPNGGWYPEERMTREEALKSYTIWGAYAAFEEKVKGSIQTGKLGDFVVIDKDYFACGETEIKEIKVLQTVLGGKVVYPVRQVSK